MKILSRQSTSQWHGKVDLVYQYKAETSSIKSVFCQAPFKIQRPFYPEGKSRCHSVILHTAGGIVGGDILKQNIRLLPHSQVLITTPAATKIYRSAEKKAIQEIKINLEENSYLEYLPQEAIVFNQAQFQQKMIVSLSENTSFLTWEINRFGRSARGENFTDGRWVSEVEIWQGKKPLWIDRKYLQGDRDHFDSLNGLNKKPVVGSLIFISEMQIDDLILLIRKLIEQKFTYKSIHITSIQKGILCLYQGDSVNLCKDMFISIWQLLRQRQDLNFKIKPRVWQ